MPLLLMHSASLNTWHSYRYISFDSITTIEGIIIMLSSIILSLAMNASPTPALDTNDFVIEEAGRRGGKAIRMSDEFTVEKAGRRGGKAIRMNNEFIVEEAGRRGGKAIRMNNEFIVEEAGRRGGKAIRM